MTGTNVSQLSDFVSYLGSVKGDLSNITAPPFALSTKSATEIPASWAERHGLFLQPSKEDDAETRALLVLKNYLCSLKRQAYSGVKHEPGTGPKKPLNAFLGELFLGKLVDEKTKSETHLISEQVSHHPPVTACAMYNKAHRMSSCGYVAQETSYSPSAGVLVKQLGHAIIRDAGHGESHLMTLPTLCITGFLTGGLYPEMRGTSYISSSSGYQATIQFKRKKTIALGDNDTVFAKLVSLRDSNKCLFTIKGRWDGEMTTTRCSDEAVVDKFNVDDVPLAEVRVEPWEAQSPWESRRAWHDVVRSIEAGDTKGVSKAKSSIEDAQREMRIVEQQTGLEWPRLFFTKTSDHPEFEVLARGIPDPESSTLQQGRTAGVWKFIGVQASEKMIAERVFHKGLEPTGQIV